VAFVRHGGVCSNDNCNVDDLVGRSRYTPAGCYVLGYAYDEPWCVVMRKTSRLS